MTEEGHGFASRHAFVLLDGSGSMKDNEQRSGQPKHKRVAEMVQQMIDMLYTFTDTYLTVIAYDADGSSNTRISEPLPMYEVQENQWKGNTDMTRWDPITRHGGGTPIGGVLAYAREKAESWISNAAGQENRRAVIFLLSDGMNTVGPDGSEEKTKIEAFNLSTSKGRIRLATVGYFQFPKGANSEEEQGRRLLRALPTNSEAYFESDSVEKILSYIMSTITSLG